MQNISSLKSRGEKVMAQWATVNQEQRNWTKFEGKCFMDVRWKSRWQCTYGKYLDHRRLCLAQTIFLKQGNKCESGLLIESQSAVIVNKQERLPGLHIFRRRTQNLPATLQNFLFFPSLISFNPLLPRWTPILRNEWHNPPISASVATTLVSSCRIILPPPPSEGPTPNMGRKAARPCLASVLEACPSLSSPIRFGRVGPYGACLNRLCWCCQFSGSYRIKRGKSRKIFPKLYFFIKFSKKLSKSNFKEIAMWISIF